MQSPKMAEIQKDRQLLPIHEHRNTIINTVRDNFVQLIISFV